ncbi:MAG: hypothetical protein AB8B55_12120 [Mariniblastus sp.]
MLRINSVLILFVVCAFGVATPQGNSASADILENSGFEAGTGNDADSWIEIVGGAAGTVSRSSIAPNTGGFSAHMAFDHINNTEAAGDYFFQQNLGANTINNAAEYDLTFFARSENNDFTGTNMFVQVQWLDQDGSDGGGFKGEVLVSIIDLGLNSDYQQFTLSGLDPTDGSDSFLLRFQVAAGPVADIANGMFVDDVFLFASVPEPASVVVLGMFGLAVCCRRSRRS